MALWHSNFGESVLGATKPEIVAPSLRVVAPILPGSSLATEAAALFAGRFGQGGDLNSDVEREVADRNLITPHYQQVEGTSFAAPIVAGTVSCMLEANPSLTPRQIKDALISSAWFVAGASRERQGAGAVDAGRAVAAALRERHAHLPPGGDPVVTGSGPVTLSLHDPAAQHVVHFGSWNNWHGPGIPTTSPEAGLFVAVIEHLPLGVHHYRFLVDPTCWMADISNPRQSTDGVGGYNHMLEVRPG